ncbi:hypothetical protein HanLR1_Chr05g0192871 [Helianthus annuus]|nr:hypothetical protein HanLR1_Chr05g0192871 [Helianthus annuus]
MSLGYAEKLSYIEDVGNVGMTEIHDPPHILQEKLLKKVNVAMCIEVWIQFVLVVKVIPRLLKKVNVAMCIEVWIQFVLVVKLISCVLNCMGLEFGYGKGDWLGFMEFLLSIMFVIILFTHFCCRLR